MPVQLPLFDLLVLCCACSRLQARGRWTQHVLLASDYPEKKFSHGICPSCFKQLYPAIARRRPPERRPLH